MTPPSSAQQSGLRLQPRDLAILAAADKHRFLRSDHVRTLLFPEVSLRVAQVRLQKLHRHGYLKRLYVPFVMDGEHAPPLHRGQPIYRLTRRGVRLLSERADRSAPSTKEPANASVLTLEHHLIVTDVLVALAVACRSGGSLELSDLRHEGVFLAQLRVYRKSARITNAIVPDGGFQLRHTLTGTTETFYLEVVRADVKGGNGRLLHKLRRYVELHRAGFFRAAYGTSDLRAVLFLTTSEVRARHLQSVALKLAHGRRLFWFGAYQEKGRSGHDYPRLSATSILATPWLSADGTSATLTMAHRETPTAP
ncbi:MAG: replication-relaxation family protein [Myxococcales bacterium]|nr:replication-relaxation family protein [Myxococcales bacterium]